MGDGTKVTSAKWFAVVFLLAVFAPAVVAQAGWNRTASMAPWSGRKGHATVAFKNKLWVLGGHFGSILSTQGDVWNSTDGVTWTKVTAAAPWRARVGHQCVVFNNEIWLMGGMDLVTTAFYNDVWSSPDGVNWTQHAATSALWAPRWGHATTVFNNRMWVFGGYSTSYLESDVWSSTDGNSWTLEVVYAQWGNREGHTVSSFNGALWLMGGTDNSYLSDVWTSSDGISWALAAHAPWSARYRHTAATYDGKLWLIGGMGTGGMAGDAFWSSPDGSNWTQESAPAWAPRMQHTSAVLDGKLWLIGGYDYSNFFADVWAYGETPQFTSTPPGTANVGSAFSYAISTSGYPTPIITATGLPGWLSLSGNLLQGVPGVGDVGLSGTITLTATNASGAANQSFQIDVLGTSPQIASTPVTSATVGVPYSYTIAATGAPAPVLSTSALPAWLSFNAATGELLGTPDYADIGVTAPITVTATNGSSPDATQTFMIDVLELPPMQGNPDPGASCGSVPQSCCLWALVAVAVLAFVGSSAGRRHNDSSLSR